MGRLKDVVVIPDYGRTGSIFTDILYLGAEDAPVFRTARIAPNHHFTHPDSGIHRRVFLSGLDQHY